MDDKTFEQRAPVIREHTVEKIAYFLKAGCVDLGITDLSIGFHGGEPMMQKKKAFAKTCDIFQSVLSPVVQLRFTMQTNAMLIDEEWISLFNKYRVCIGISIDGTKEYHDVDRVDHYGRGTYDRVVKKIKFLQQSNYFKNKSDGVGLLCVINPKHSARKIYRHFVDDLGARFIDFLLPYNTHMHPLDDSVESYGEYLSELFDEWTKDDNPKVQIRRFSSLLGLFYGAEPEVYAVGKIPEHELPLISISSEGELSPSDEFRATAPQVNYSGETVFNSSLKNYLENPIFKNIQRASVELPSVCQRCCWKNICAGGTIVNRYHESNLFDNPSIYCTGLKNFYANIAAYLVRNNYPYDRLMKTLDIEKKEVLNESV